VEVYVGLTKAKVTYQGRSGCCVGVDQIFFTVPSGITGCEIPVAVKIGNVVSNFVTMPIAGASSSGTNQEHATASRVCTDAGGPSQTSIAEYLKNGFSGGFIGLDRSVTTSPALPPPIGTGSPTTSTTDTGSGSFAKVSAASLSVAVNPFQVTTIGTCTVFAFAGQSAVSPTNITSTVLDAGPALTVNGPHGAMQLPKSSGGGYYAQLGGGSSGGLGFFTNPAYGINAATVMPLYLDPGDYTVTGPGGADVGPFTAKITIAPPLTWTNESSISTVIRANGQLVTWTGGDPMSTVIISGSSIQLGTNPDGSDTLGAFFTCYAPDSAGQFDIPALVLDVLPPSSVIPEVNIPAGSLSIGTDQNASFTAKGLDIGTISSNVTIGNTVAYQ